MKARVLGVLRSGSPRVEGCDARLSPALDSAHIRGPAAQEPRSQLTGVQGGQAKQTLCGFRLVPLRVYSGLHRGANGVPHFTTVWHLDETRRPASMQAGAERSIVRSACAAGSSQLLCTLVLARSLDDTLSHCEGGVAE